MEIRSILVNVGLGDQRHDAVTYAARLAEAFDAEVIGLAAAEPDLASFGMDGAVQIALDYYAVERQTIEAQLAEAQERFRAAMPPTVPVQWCSYVANTTNALIEQAVRCDVVVVSPSDGAETRESLDPGHLLLTCGRPVVLAGDDPRSYSLEQVVVAWKDTREARKAVVDALPLLRRGSKIKVVTRSEGERDREARSLADIVAWLRRHGLEAESELVAQDMEFSVAAGISAPFGHPDLIVSGGYGHSRFREWLFGGVTHDLLRAKNVNRFISN